MTGVEQRHEICEDGNEVAGLFVGGSGVIKIERPVVEPGSYIELACRELGGLFSGIARCEL